MGLPFLWLCVRAQGGKAAANSIGELWIPMRLPLRHPDG